MGHITIPLAAREGAAHFPLPRRVLGDEGATVGITASTHRTTAKSKKFTAPNCAISITREPMRIAGGVKFVSSCELSVQDRPISLDFSLELSEQATIKPICCKELRVSLQDVSQC